MIRTDSNPTLRFVERNGRFILQQCVLWREIDDDGRVTEGGEWRDIPVWDETKQEYRK